MGNRLLLLSGLLLLFKCTGYAQPILFSESFESAANWNTTGVTGPNTWITGSCSGNGASGSGSTAAYINSGGSIPGCGPSGSSAYEYVNAASGTASAIYYRSVPNLCFASLQLAFDIQIDGNVQDYVEVVYSTTNGVSWIPVSSQLSGVSGWQTQSVNLPATLNNTSFWLGFRFTYDNVLVNGNPAAIDNVVLRGTTADVTPPVASCPASVPIYANASCTATVPDLPPSVTKSDNCTAVSDLMISQVPAIASTATGNTTATITVTDQAGNAASCTTNLVFTDTIRPTVTCPGNQNAAVGSGCQYTMVSMTGLLTANDNCTASGSLSTTQTPVPGINLSEGVHVVTLYASDAAGNLASCQFSLTVEDTTAPVVTCPTYHHLPSNALCMAHVGNLSTVPLAVTDNCTSVAGLFAYSQVPAATTTFSDTIAATIYVTDAAGNVGNCQLLLVAADTVAPIVTCISDTTVSTVNPCNYTIPNLAAAFTTSDACPGGGVLSFSQTPIAGSLASGVTDVVLSVTDVFGNQGVCHTMVRPQDVVMPQITCPSNQNVANGTDCNYTLQDYTSLVLVTDNCQGYTIGQSPAASTVVQTGHNVITLTVTDAGMNQSSCTFVLFVAETQMPAIACPPNMTSCTATVSYQAPAAMDNCAFSVVQTDNSGMTSGSVFPQGITTQTYMAIDSSGNTATCSFTVEVLEIPDPAVISLDTLQLCNEFATALSADVISQGTGNWSVLEGNGVFASTSNPTTNVSGLAEGINRLMWMVSSPSCGVKRDTLVVRVWPMPSQAFVQDSLLACSEEGLFFHAAVPQKGTGTWSSSSGIVFDDVHAPVTGVSNLNGGSHTVVWTVSSGICPSTSDTMFVTFPNKAVIQAPNATICSSDLPMQLTGSTPAPGQHAVWSTASGSAEFSADYAPVTTLNSASFGNVEIVYWLTDPVCGNSTDTLVLTVKDCNTVIEGIPSMFTPNGDGKNDLFYIPKLAVTYPGCRVEIFNRWGGAVFESDGYAAPWDGTFKGEAVPMGTYFYLIQLNDSEDSRIEGSISIIR